MGCDQPLQGEVVLSHPRVPHCTQHAHVRAQTALYVKRVLVRFHACCSQSLRQQAQGAPLWPWAGHMADPGAGEA